MSLKQNSIYDVDYKQRKNEEKISLYSGEIANYPSEIIIFFYYIGKKEKKSSIKIKYIKLAVIYPNIIIIVLDDWK